MVDFITSNNLSDLQECGVASTSLFSKLKGELAPIILPSLYIGLPLLLVVISILMFLAGFYYNRGKEQEESLQGEQTEREMVHKVVRRLETERIPQSPISSVPVEEGEKEKQAAVKKSKKK